MKRSTASSRASPSSPTTACRDPCVVALLLVAAEGLEEGFLGWEPPIEGGS